MNYEALGRYTEAKERAEKLAAGLHNTMTSIDSPQVRETPRSQTKKSPLGAGFWAM